MSDALRAHQQHERYHRAGHYPVLIVHQFVVDDLIASMLEREFRIFEWLTVAFCAQTGRT